MLNGKAGKEVVPPRRGDLAFYNSVQRQRDFLGLSELWSHLDLVRMLVKRELLGTYSNTMLGIVWRLTTPLTTLAGYSLVFGLFGQVKFATSAPYPVVLFCGLLPWLIFSTTLVSLSNSIFQNSALITKIYFPRLIPLIVSLIDKLVDMAVGLCILVALLVATGLPIGMGMLETVVYLVWALVLAFAAGLWLSWITVLFRDIRHALPMALQFVFYLSPVVYPISAVPEKYQWVFQINPVVSIINGMRWSILGLGSPPNGWTVYALIVTFLLLIGGLIFFRRAERVLVDIL